jgi:hypothetical protein
MRCVIAVMAAATLGLLPSGVATQIATPVPLVHALNNHQARQIVRLVARYDHIDLNDSHVEMNSLDLMSPFISGYASFILIREATTPGPDQTLHRYAVNRQTGDVWEMTECTRYDFSALTRLQRALTGQAATPAEIETERQELGCSARKSSTDPVKSL